MSLFSFSKTVFKESKQIRSLYDKKIELLLNSRKESTLNPRETEILQLLRRAKDFDPRYLGTCFGLEKEAKIGVTIAENLDRLSDKEFLISSYPYEWLYELKQKTICRVTNKEAVDAIENNYKNENDKKTSPLLEIIKGDITELDVDAIVNSAHPSLLAGSGICGTIHKVAGKRLEEECKTLVGNVPPDQVALTHGYNLKAKYVLHVVIPPAKERGKLSNPEKDTLIDCYKKVIHTANRCGIKTLAIPSLGTGILGYPVREVAELAVKTLYEYLDEYVPGAFEEIYLVTHSSSDYEVYKHAYDKYLKKS